LASEGRNRPIPAQIPKDTVLFILIAIAWLAVLMLLVAGCRVCADGERQGSSATWPPRGAIGERLILRPTPSAIATHATRAHRGRLASRAARPTRRRVAVHGSH
jgi:hypothetical protein